MDACDHAVHDFHHDTHELAHAIGGAVNHQTGHGYDHSHDSDWGHIVESAVNTGASWAEMNKACDVYNQNNNGVNN